MTSKAALDFAFNFGSAKQFQFYVEPSINFAFLGQSNSHNVSASAAGPVFTEVHADYGYKATGQAGQPAYNINNSFVQLNAGLVYKFANSNGTHNFTIVTPRDQAEIDALNAQINELRNRKPEVITKEVVKQVVKEVPSVKEFTVSDLVFVTFAQGKSALTKDAKAALNNVKQGVHVQVVGTASPEGSKELNDRLSQARADVVANYLKGRGVIVDEATGKGVQGVTSNRLAVVYVK